LKRLRKDRFSRSDVLRASAQPRIAGGDPLFFPPLNFLYLLGLIEYRGATYTAESVGNNDVI
ncbi:hypothetical protein FGX00_01295, partial [Xylella fastidiosa subsp. multiplex]|nr:hypothetical protein [Xylella fastidiosa subsp. multiplex]